MPVTVLYSSRTAGRIIFRDELSTPTANLTVSIHLTRERCPGYAYGHIEADHLAAVVGEGSDTADGLEVFVCGPTSFVEAMAQHLLSLDLEPRSIKTERFG